MTLHPYCPKCGWRKGGLDSWNGHACKCGQSEPPIKPVAALLFAVALAASAVPAKAETVIGWIGSTPFTVIVPAVPAPPDPALEATITRLTTRPAAPAAPVILYEPAPAAALAPSAYPAYSAPPLLEPGRRPFWERQELRRPDGK